MTEAELQARITAGTRREPGLCAQLGLMWFHPYDSRKSPHGWPDLVIARRHVKGVQGGAVLFAELKRESGKVTAAQETWLEALTFAGCTTRVWRPSQLLDGTIARELAAVAGLSVAGPWRNPCPVCGATQPSAGCEYKPDDEDLDAGLPAGTGGGT